jgi:hypothetical protein
MPKNIFELYICSSGNELYYATVTLDELKDKSILHIIPVVFKPPKPAQTLKPQEYLVMFNGRRKKVTKEMPYYEVCLKMLRKEKLETYGE